MAAKELVCENVVKCYGKKRVLEGVNLTIEPHKIYGLIGRNGAGKTTLLGIMTAQNTMDSGSVTYGGQRVWENQRVLDALCFSRELSQVTMFGNNSMKVKEYLRMARTYYPKWDQAYAERLIDQFGLDMKGRICKMSKGMLSQVTIIVALASKADVTILDEPVAGLDVFMRDRFYSLLLEEYADTERTFILSTHIIEEAANLLEEVVILNNGVITLKENTAALIASCRYISGREDVVSEAVQGLPVLHSETIGRSRTVCVKTADAIERKLAAYDVDVSPVPLQKIFVYLTKKDGEAV